MRRACDFVKRFYWKAYEDNITGLSAMVAYNLLLSILPLALLALFIAGQVLGSGHLEQSVLDDLRRLFPDAASSTITSVLDGLQRFSTRLGIAALVTSLWFGSSFWGALDTAFCRIYRLKCRSWLEQKRFALAMLVVVLLFMAATVIVPTARASWSAARATCPSDSTSSGLRLRHHARGRSPGAVRHPVPRLLGGSEGRLPWDAIWPGATIATVAIAVVDYAFPFYLTTSRRSRASARRSCSSRSCSLWFYVLAIIILAGRDRERDAPRFRPVVIQIFTSRHGPIRSSCGYAADWIVHPRGRSLAKAFADLRSQGTAVLQPLRGGGRNILRSAELLERMLRTYPEHGELARDILICEQDGDRITHDIIQRLNETFVTPIDREDIYELASASTTSSTTSRRSPTSSGSTRSRLRWSRPRRCRGCCSRPHGRSTQAMPRLRNFGDIHHFTVELNRLENEGDRLVREALASLFEEGIDPMFVIRWKDIYERLEDAIDATETVAHMLENIVIKNS